MGYGADVKTLQAPFLELEKALPQCVPKPLRERLIVARDLIEGLGGVSLAALWLLLVS